MATSTKSLPLRHLQLKDPLWPLNIPVRVRFKNWKYARDGIITREPCGYIFTDNRGFRQIRGTWDLSTVVIIETGQIWSYREDNR